MADSTEYDLVITNGVCVTASDIAAFDIGICGENITLLAPLGSLASASTKRLIDARVATSCRAAWTVTSLKIYLTYEAPQLRDCEILSVLAEARANKVLTMIHAENGDVLTRLTEQLEKRGLVAPR